MRKLFLLIPALVLSLAVNASVINITPTSPDAGGDNLRKALNSANDGDEIVMAAGTYVESNGDYIAFTGKHVTVRAAEGAEVLIQPQVPITIAEGGCAHFENVKIDASRLTELASWYSHLIYPTDDTGGNSLILDGCEIYGYTAGKAVIAARSSNVLESVIINNCKFYNHTTRSCVFLENTDNQKLKVTNSTFYNIATGTEDFSAGIIDNRSTTAEVRVDHCTFYNVEVKSTSYATIGQIKTSDAIVSNCIFAFSESASSNYRTIRDAVAANNCLVYNYTADGGYGMQSNVTKTNCFIADPQFTDAAHGDFSFLSNNWVTMILSPACGTATNGTDLGDPRWYTTPTLPETNFASPYQFKGDKAVLTGNIWYDDVNDYIYGNGGSNKVYGTATWKFKALKAGIVEVAVNLNSGNTSGHKLRVEVRDADGNSVGEFAEQTSTLPGTLSIPVVGDYTVILHDDQEWSSAKIDNVTFSYIGGAVQTIPGSANVNEAWFSSNGTRSAGAIEYSSVESGCWAKWNVAVASAGTYNVVVDIRGEYGHNITVEFLKEGSSTPINISEGTTIYDNDLTLYQAEIGAVALEAANYIMTVSNAIGDAAFLGAEVTYAGGGTIDVPATLLPEDATLSEYARLIPAVIGSDPDTLTLAPIGGEGHASDADYTVEGSQYVKWSINVSKAGKYKITANTYNFNGHNFRIILLNENETSTIISKQEAESGHYDWNKQDGTLWQVATDVIDIAAGKYVVMVQNYKDSKGRLLNVEVSYEGGAVVNIPNNDIPFADAILSENATRNLASVPQEIHFGSPNATQYARWNIHATAGLYTFTFDVVGTNYGIYKLDILNGSDNIYTHTEEQDESGQVAISNVFIPAEGDYVLQLANINDGANGYLTSLAATAENDVFILDDNKTDDGSIAAAAGNTYTFLLKRSFEAGRYYTICIPVGSWDDELKLAFGNDYELWQMTSATQSGDEIDLNFTQINGQSFHAGWPYIIKPSVAVQNPIFYNKKEIENHTYNNTQSFDAADFIGTFYKSEIPAGKNNLYLQNNNLYYSESNATPIKGSRAWIRIKTAGGASGVRARIVLGGQVATSINLINGEMVNGTVKTIENGQLIIIRDGVRYNALGTRIQ